MTSSSLSLFFLPRGSKMANASAPSMSAAGWIEDIAEKTDTLFGYCYQAQKSQPSSFSEDAVCSLAWIFQEYGHDEISLCGQLQTRLEAYLKPYYDKVQVSAAVRNTEKQELEGKTNISLRVIVSENGKEYSLGSLIETADNKVLNLIMMNNGT